MAQTRQPQVTYDCAQCPAYCCTVYSSVCVTEDDVNRLAEHLEISPKTVIRRYTRRDKGLRVLRRADDTLFDHACIFLNHETRQCGVYEARPEVCRKYPGRSQCPYYDLLNFERQTEEDKNVLINITFMEIY